MNKIIRFTIALFISVFFFSYSCKSPEKQALRPNIIFIMADDMVAEMGTSRFENEFFPLLKTN